MKNSPNISNLISLLAEGKINIIVMHQPKISENIEKQIPQDVTHQYRPVIKEFYDIIKSIPPTKDLKLYRPLS